MVLVGVRVRIIRFRGGIWGKYHVYESSHKVGNMATCLCEHASVHVSKDSKEGF